MAGGNSFYEDIIINIFHSNIHPVGYERVYLPLYKVADTPFRIRGDDIVLVTVIQITVTHWKTITTF